MSSARRLWRAVRAHLAAGPGRAPTSPCACGHPHEAHEHYRRGSDCALCSCGSFRAR